APAPFVANEAHGRDETDAGRRYGGLLRDVLHLPSYEVEGDQDAPDLLHHADWSATEDRLLTLQHVRLDFVLAELDFPSLMIERDDFESGILGRVCQRRQQPLSTLRAGMTVADGSRGEGLR